MDGYGFETARRIVCKPGGAADLAEMAGELGMSRVMLVCDRGVLDAGLTARATDGLKRAGIAVALFSGVKADPPEAVILKAVEAARAADIDGVVGFGGGSSLDTAKLVALLAATPQRLEDAYGIGLAKGPRLPLIQVPTTAGTGSEVTPIAIVTTPSNEKKGVVSSLLLPDIALLDGDLTLGLPPHVTAATGIDAMVHAIEAFTSRHKKNPISDALAVKALALLSANIRTAVDHGGDRAARAAMLQGATLAGMAFANAPVAAVHALAYPIGGHFHVAHGLSNSLVLPHVLRFNLPAALNEYAELAAVMLPDARFGGAEEAADAMIAEVEAIIDAVGIETRLTQVGVKEADLPLLAGDAMKVERLLINNPREVTYDDAVAIYRRAL